MSDRLRDYATVSYRVVRLNPRLKIEILRTLLDLKLANPLIVDQDVYPHSILCAQQDYEHLRGSIDPEFLRRTRLQDHTFALQFYIAYRSGRREKKIVEGCSVILVLDGNAYTVKSVDSVAESAVITLQQKGVTMRVPLSVLKLKE